MPSIFQQELRNHLFEIASNAVELPCAKTILLTNKVFIGTDLFTEKILMSGITLKKWLITIKSY